MQIVIFRFVIQNSKILILLIHTISISNHIKLSVLIVLIVLYSIVLNCIKYF